MLPALIVLLFGGFEAGNFMWTQHKLVTAAREGARYASRLPIDKFCDASSPATDAQDADAIEAIRIVTATGFPPDANNDPVAPDRVEGIQVAVSDEVCGLFSPTGIYTQLGTAGPRVTVTASASYASLFGGLGVLTNGIPLAARSDGAVIGI